MNKRRQGARTDVLLLTGSDIIPGTLDSEPDYIVSPDTLEAWEKDKNQQAIDTSKKGRYFQVISDINKKPLVLFPDKVTKSNIPPKKPVIDKKNESIINPGTSVIAFEAQEEALSVMDNRRQKNHLLIWVGIVAGILALTFAIAVLLKLSANNQTHALLPLLKVIVC